jgi:hypothetical protein
LDKLYNRFKDWTQILHDAKIDFDIENSKASKIACAKDLYPAVQDMFVFATAAQSKHNQALFNIEYVIWYLAWILKVSNAIFNVPTQTNPTST